MKFGTISYSYYKPAARGSYRDTQKQNSTYDSRGGSPYKQLSAAHHNIERRSSQNQKVYGQTKRTNAYRSGSSGSSAQQLRNAIEIIPDKLYFNSGSYAPSGPDLHVYNIDNDGNFIYEPFNNDFGPLHLGQVHSYCQNMAKMMTGKGAYQGKTIVHHTGSNPKKTANSILLMGAYLILHQKESSQHIWNSLFKDLTRSIDGFVDAGQIRNSFRCTVLDCWKAIERASQLGWYKPASFNLRDYNKFAQLSNGDMNWVVPYKILALSSPSSGRRQGTSPSVVLDAFYELNVRAIVRLNEEMYRAEEFENDGVNVYELEFPDGSCPNDAIVSRFFEICDNHIQKGEAVAVHCRAGLGRTGCLIGAYIMYKFGFDARQLIAWMRICRPGMVVGPQQDFLVEIEHRVKNIARGN